MYVFVSKKLTCVITSSAQTKLNVRTLIATNLPLSNDIETVSLIAIFVLKGDVKL